MTTVLKGITWEHARGYGSVAAAAEAYRSVAPDVEVRWEQRSLQAFADQPLESLVEQYDLLVIDHPHIPLAAEHGLFARLDGVGHDERARRPRDPVGRPVARDLRARRRAVGIGDGCRGPGRGVPPGPAARAAARLGRRARAGRAGARALAVQARRRVLEPGHRRVRQRRGADALAGRVPECRRARRGDGHPPPPRARSSPTRTAPGIRSRRRMRSAPGTGSRTSR